MTASDAARVLEALRTDLVEGQRRAMRDAYASAASYGPEIFYPSGATARVLFEERIGAIDRALDALARDWKP